MEGASATSVRASPGMVVLEARKVGKRYGSVQALEAVTLAVRAGEVHAILGENGAGKTTLMRILAGEERPDSGELLLEGRRVVWRSPVEARAHGVAMVHQHFALADSLTVAENLALALAASGERRLRLEVLEARVRHWVHRTGLDIPPLASRVAHLSVGARQRLEILKALVAAHRVLILDEPTAVLTPQEARGLFALVRQLQREQRAVLFISHKLGEVAAIADYVTVLRQGRVVAEMRAPLRDMQALVRAMVGELQVEWRKPSGPRGETLLAVRDLSTRATDYGTALERVSFAVHAGEVLGIAGVDGNGQRELFEVLAGLRAPASGEMRVGDRPLRPRSPADVLAAGIDVIPPDRRREGLVLQMSVAENLLLHHRSLAALTRRSGLIDWRRVRAHARTLVAEYGIRVADIDTPVQYLSGGNQQRTILARELTATPRVLVAVNPTRGLDFAATQFVFHTLAQLAARGAGVVLISTDLDEVLALSDRVAVLYRGHLSEALEPPIDPERLGALMAGLAVARPS